MMNKYDKNEHVKIWIIMKLVSKIYSKHTLFPFRRLLGRGGGGFIPWPQNKHTDQPAHEPLRVRMTLETSAVYMDADQSALLFACRLKR